MQKMEKVVISKWVLDRLIRYIQRSDVIFYNILAIISEDMKDYCDIQRQAIKKELADIVRESKKEFERIKKECPGKIEEAKHAIFNLKIICDVMDPGSFSFRSFGVP